MPPESKKIALACDHRGVEMKNLISRHLQSRHFDVVDCGTHSEESVDYPDFMFMAAEKVSSGECMGAIGICYTGIGSSIAANKVRGVRASLVHSPEEARLTRAHNDSNMLILGAGFLDKASVIPIVDAWMTTSFEGGRHEQRVNKIRNYEQQNRK